MASSLCFALLLTFLLHSNIAEAQLHQELLKTLPAELHHLLPASLEATLKNDEPVTTTAKPKTESNCPAKESIAPCYCSKYQGQLILTCYGENVTQHTLNKMNGMVRAANNLRRDQTLQLYFLSVVGTNMTNLDLTALAHTNSTLLMIIANPKLTSISTARSAKDHHSIETVCLLAGSSPINDNGFGDTLKMFHSNTKYMFLVNMQLEGGRYGIGARSEESSNEFLPSLSYLRNLEYLNLWGNQIKEVGGGQFRRNSKLFALALGNNITEIGNDAFVFDPVAEGKYYNNKSRIIQLFNNSLSSKSFRKMSRTGLTNGQKPIILDCHFNNFVDLVESIWRPFLEANNGQNKINLYGNPLVCGPSMSWLKAGKDEYESRVLFPNCTNDNQRSVFESSAVP